MVVVIDQDKLEQLMTELANISSQDDLQEF